MEIDINGFKAAAARLFFDMINADGVIEDNEILLLEGFRKCDPPKDDKGNPVDLPNFSKDANKLIRAGGLRYKYSIDIDQVREATKLTTATAIKNLIDWQKNGQKEEIKYNSKSVFTTGNVITDLGVISGCDGSRDINEAKLLAAISLCLNEEVPSYMRAIPISYRERTLRFARKEIVYLESEYDEVINEDIKVNKAYIESLLTIYGYDFVYIPTVVDFLKEKAKSDLLEPILMFTNPFYYQDEKRTADFARDVQSITTEDFTNTFCRAANLEEDLPPCLLIKVKTSSIESHEADGQPKRTKYTDFIALPINGSVVDSVRRLPDNILEHTDAITSLVTKTMNEKLYSKGIHKTLIDYAVHRSSVNIVEKVVITLQGKKKTIEFVGIDGGLVKAKPTEAVLYLLAIIYSILGSGVCKRKDNSEECVKMMKTYSRLYEIATENEDVADLYKSLSVTKTNLKRKINELVKLVDKDKYNLDDKGDSIRVNVNPDIVFIRDSYNDTEFQMDEWLRRKRIKI